jgi:predicted transcriptional regulator
MVIPGGRNVYQYSDHEVQQVAKQILTHLQENPHKNDSLKGICEWWLFEERINYTIDLVTNALQFLLSNNLITERKKFDTNCIYQINQLRKNETAPCGSQARGI